MNQSPAPVCSRCKQPPDRPVDFGKKRLLHCACASGPHTWRRRWNGAWELWLGWPLERWEPIPVVDGVAQVPDPKELFSRQARMRRLLGVVAAHYGFTSEQLIDGTQELELKRPRHVAMHVLRVVLGLTHRDLGAVFGCHRTAVLYALRGIEAALEADGELRHSVACLTRGASEAA